VELLPLIRRNYQAAIESTVLRTAKILSEDSRCVESLAAQWLTHRSVSFSSLAVAVQRRALVIQLLRMKLPSSFETVEHLRLHPGDPLTLTPDVTVFRETGGKLKLGRKVSLAFKPRSKLIRFTHKTGNGTMAGMAFQWRLARTKTDGKIQPQAGREIFDTEKIGTHIRLRHWQPGDRFQPIGLKSAAKLQDLLVNKKIPAQQRRRLIVAETSTGQIFWVEGLRIGEIAKVTPQTHLHLTWRWSR
jgi:tRNA(Ile)-lysidine synthetase-like protein